MNCFNYWRKYSHHSHHITNFNTNFELTFYENYCIQFSYKTKNTVHQGPWFAEHSNFIGTVVESEEILVDILVHAHTTGCGSGGLRVWNESAMMIWMRALMTTEGETVPLTKKFSYPERIF